MSIVIPVDVINIILDYADIYCEECKRNNMRICYIHTGNMSSNITCRIRIRWENNKKEIINFLKNYNWFNNPRHYKSIFCYICVNNTCEEYKYNRLIDNCNTMNEANNITTKELEDEKNRLKNEDYVRLRITPRKQLYNILLKL